MPPASAQTGKGARHWAGAPKTAPLRAHWLGFHTSYELVHTDMMPSTTTYFLVKSREEKPTRSPVTVNARKFNDQWLLNAIWQEIRACKIRRHRLPAWRVTMAARALRGLSSCATHWNIPPPPSPGSAFRTELGAMLLSMSLCCRPPKRNRPPPPLYAQGPCRAPSRAGLMAEMQVSGSHSRPKEGHLDTRSFGDKENHCGSRYQRPYRPSLSHFKTTCFAKADPVLHRLLSWF